MISNTRLEHEQTVIYDRAMHELNERYAYNIDTPFLKALECFSAKEAKDFGFSLRKNIKDCMIVEGLMYLNNDDHQLYDGSNESQYKINHSTSEFNCNTGKSSLNSIKKIKPQKSIPYVMTIKPSIFIKCNEKYNNSILKDLDEDSDICLKNLNLQRENRKNLLSISTNKIKTVTKSIIYNAKKELKFIKSKCNVKICNLNPSISSISSKKIENYNLNMNTNKLGFNNIMKSNKSLSKTKKKNAINGEKLIENLLHNNFINNSIITKNTNIYIEDSFNWTFLANKNDKYCSKKNSSIVEKLIGSNRFNNSKKYFSIESNPNDKPCF